MGKRLNISQTTVIQTELIPLTDIFELIPNGLTEQWFYENTNVFKPDRQITPLIITPKVTAVDEDTHITYQPSLYIVQWYALEYNGTAWVETEITNITQGLQYDYVKVDNSLQVNKNISDATHGVQIKCRAQYSDPRDNGIVYAVEETISLTANKDATVIYPTIDILNESAQSFNPLGDRSSQFTFKGTANWDGVPNPSENIIKYAVDPKGTEAIIPDNESVLVTSAPTMDIRYGKGSGSVLKEDQQFMYRQVSGGTVSPIGSNLAFIEKIKGNTVKYIQLFNNSRLNTQYSSITPTLTAVSNGIRVVITGATGDSKYFNVNVFANSNELGLKTGHKYYICDRKNDSRFQLGMGIGNALTYISNNAAIISPTYKGTDSTFFRYNTSMSGNADVVLQPQIFDLTDMGIANLTTVDEVESWLAANIGLKSYYPYNAGELIPVKMSAIKSVGFNLWDEQYTLSGLATDGSENPSFNRITSNFIRVQPSTTYYLRWTTSNDFYLAQYDINKECCVERTRYAENRTFTTASNTAFVRFMVGNGYGTTYNHDICINLSDASRNGTYEAHWEAEQYLPITELKGKVNGTGDSVVIFPNGLKKVGNVQDEIFVGDGVIKAIKRVGSVDLGSFSYQVTQWNGATAFFPIGFVGISNYRTPANNDRVVNAICPSFVATTRNINYANTAKLPLMSAVDTGFQIRHPTIETESAFITAMSGVMLYYELATPVEYIIDNMPRGQFEWYGVKNGTEVKIDTLPCYVSGQHTDTLVVDAMYSENLAVILRIKELAGDLTCLPPRAQRTVAWRTPNVDSIITSDKGGAVRSDSDEFNFGTIVNTQGQTLSDEKIDANLRFKWSTRKSNGSTVTQRGWGRNITLKKADLINVRGVNNTLASTHVDNEVYLLGAYEEVTYDGETLTYSGSPLFGRQLDEEN